MKEEYVIINKLVLEKRIEELEKIDEKEIWEHMEYDTLKHILSQSTPLIPEIEKAFDAANERNFNDERIYICSDEYISNLKLDI